MKINLTKFSLTLLAALTLAACGSGGGGGSEPSKQNPSQVQSPNPTDNGRKPNDDSKKTDGGDEKTSDDGKKTDGGDEKLDDSGKKPDDSGKKPDDSGRKPDDIGKKTDDELKTQEEKKITRMMRIFPARGEQNTGLALSGDQDAKIEYKLIELFSGDMTQINVDGRVIPLDFDYSDNGWTKKVEPNEENNKKLNGTPYFCCGTYTDVRFGAVENGEAGKSNIIFYTGNPTKQIPDTGKIVYKGESIFSSDDSEKFYNLYTKGTSEFTADFVNKTLSGHIDVNNVKVDINADIAGNRFYGDAESNSLKSKGTAEGRFFGENAKELGGIVEAKDHSWGGSFGAQKAQ